MPAPCKRRSRLTVALLLPVIWLGSPQIELSAQQPQAVQKPNVKHEGGLYVSPEPVNCESFAAIVDTALAEWQNLAGTYFIVIVRPGISEKPGGLNRSRLSGVEFYLKQRLNGKMGYVITAEGRRTEGSGKMEIYIAGKLRVEIPIRKNDARVCTGKVNPFL
jgi:hypothetical protein